MFYFRLQCRFVASNSQLQYSDIVDGKPVTLSMAIDSIESLQRQLNDVERKVCTLTIKHFILQFAGDWVGVYQIALWDCFWALALL